MVDRAASAPLLPALVPARSMACSMVSTVSTPLASGITGTTLNVDAGLMAGNLPFLNTLWPETQA